MKDTQAGLVDCSLLLNAAPNQLPSQNRPEIRGGFSRKGIPLTGHGPARNGAWDPLFALVKDLQETLDGIEDLTSEKIAALRRVYRDGDKDRVAGLKEEASRLLGKKNLIQRDGLADSRHEGVLGSKLNALYEYLESKKEEITAIQRISKEQRDKLGKLCQERPRRGTFGEFGRAGSPTHQRDTQKSGSPFNSPSSPKRRGGR